MNQQQIDNLRRQMQAADINAKKERLKNEFGAIEIHSSGNLPPEIELEWYDYMCRFEAHYAEVEIVNVWERLGQPPIKLIGDVDPAALKAHFDELMALLEKRNIIVDFLGDWELPAAYQYITEDLIYEEIEAEPFDDTFTHFNPTTPAYDIQFWIEHLILCVVIKDRLGVNSSIVPDKLCDGAGRPITPQKLNTILDRLWAKLPDGLQFDVAPPAIEIAADRAKATATITWGVEEAIIAQKSHFELIREPHDDSFWDVCQTTLLDDLAQILGVEGLP